MAHGHPVPPPPKPLPGVASIVAIGSGKGGVERMVQDLFKGTIPLREVMDSLGIKLPGLLGTETAPAKLPDNPKKE